MQYSDEAPEGIEPRAQGAQPPGAGQLPAGAPPSITAPANSITGGPVRILRSGFDSLYLSYAGRIGLDTANKLKTLKEAAQATEPGKQALAVFPIEKHRFEVWDRGTRRFPFVLSDNDYFIAVKGLGAKQLPLAHVQIGSGCLLSRGVPAACDLLAAVVSQLGVLSEEPAQVSRVDLYCDFTSEYPIHQLALDAWVSRAKSVNAYSADSRVVSGYSIGQGGDISCRLYDKTKEIVASDKPYWKDAWIDAGWWPGKIVWRLEFQFRRRVLGEHGIDSVPDLLRLAGPLWRYATLSWLKLTEPSDTDETQSRWPLHPIWETISQVNWEGSESGTSLPNRSDRPPSDDYLFENGLSGLTSFMAREGIENWQEGSVRYIEAAERFHNSRSHIVGIDFAGYLRERAAIKAKQYNRSFPEVDEKREEMLREAYAKEYRKLKDGE